MPAMGRKPTTYDPREEIDCAFFDYDGVLTTDATGSATTCAT